MDRSAQTIHLLESSLREQGFQTAFDESIPERPGMRTLIPLREDGTGLVRVELHYVPCGELFDILQLYTTVIEDMEEHGVRELRKAVEVWNFSVFLGSLSVREDRRELFHRYCLALSGKLSAEECAVVGESVLTSVLRSISPFYEDAMDLANGAAFEEPEDARS